MKKRFLPLAVLVLFVVSLCAGCKPGDGSSSGGGTKLPTGSKVTGDLAFPELNKLTGSTFTIPVSYTHLDVYKRQSFATPNGLFVDGKGLIYVADTENKRVVICSEDGRVVRLLSKPQSEVNFTGIDFLPMKVVADDTGYTYLLCKGIYHGAVVYTPEGRFSGYFGANTTEVTLSVILDNFWRKLYTACLLYTSFI